MTQKQLTRWIMYHEIHKLNRLGFKKARIAQKLGINSRTVKVFGYD